MSPQLLNADRNVVTSRVDQVPTFIVTSGRSGSTMLARMLHRHPEVVCISDLIEPVGAVPLIDRSAVVAARDFLAALQAPSLPERIRYWRSQPTDELLHLPECDDDVSLLLTYTLPFLDPHDPSALLDELCIAMSERGPATMADHSLAAFAWLRDRFGGTHWVERTGGSLPHAQKMVQAFPDGRFVHLHRDPAEVAISMQTGSFFRLYLLLESDPDLERWNWDVVPSPAVLAEMVDQWETSANDAWEHLPAERLLRLSYESVMNDATRVLQELVGFLLDRPTNAMDGEWAQREAAGLRPVPLRRMRLPHVERSALEHACRQSRRMLGYV